MNLRSACSQTRSLLGTVRGGSSSPLLRAKTNARLRRLNRPGSLFSAKFMLQGGCNEAVTPIKYLDCHLNLKSNKSELLLLTQEGFSPVNSLNSRENGLF